MNQTIFPKMFVVFLCAYGWFGLADAAPPRSWNQANKCFAEFRFDCAIKSYREALAELPPQLSRSERLGGLIRLALSYFNQGELQNAAKIFLLALELHPCAKVSGQAPNVSSYFEQQRKRWCKQNSKRCKSCECQQLLCKKDCVANPASSPMRRIDCEQYKQNANGSTPGLQRATRTPPAIIAGAVISGVALAAVIVGTGLFFSNESADQPLREKLASGNTALSQVDSSRLQTAGPNATAGQVFLIGGGVLLTAGLVALVIGVLQRPTPPSAKLSQRGLQPSSEHRFVLLF